MVRLSKLSIAAKLYAIFALLATATVILALVAVVNGHRRAALTQDFEAAFKGEQYVERINGLIYAVRLESRGIIMSTTAEAAKPFAAKVVSYGNRVSNVVDQWKSVLVAKDAEKFQSVVARIKQLQDFSDALVAYAASIGQKSLQNWGNIEANLDVRIALNQDLEAFGQIYSQRSKEIYAEMDRSMTWGGVMISILGAIAILLAAAGSFFIRYAVTRPLAEITRVTEAVAEGNAVAIPYGARRDEIGALSRSIAVFQHAMHHNADLNRTVVKDADARVKRQEQIAAEIAAFTGSIERSISDLGAISDQMLESANQLTDAADRAADRTAGATAASSEASSNVRDIASAADELAASVMEIDRQVAQSNAIAEKAVIEAERTNSAVLELGEAAKRIGDVVSLITDIAEQTNLLALNATIEAARAGEAGRGFAVVAGEVKALAGQTAKATEDIAAQISDMQHATERSIGAIGAIERTIRDIGAISGAIAAAVTEQGAATQEIARSVDVAAKRTIETAEEVSRVGDATDNTRANVSTVKSVADELGAVAHRIRDQVEAFSEKLRAA
jgi:methyl-accepting chemotaxis protein